jgi:hypothetical protein
MEKQVQEPNRRQLPLIAHWVLVGVALGLAYVAVSRAIDTGSLLEYAVGLTLFILGVKHLVQAARLAGKKG